MSMAMKLSRRESQVMEVLFRKGATTARDVWTELGEERTYSTIRKLLSILEEKGHVTHHREGAAFVYSPSQRRDSAARSALSRVVETFFDGSVEGAVTSLLGSQTSKLSAEELERIGRMIVDAQKETGKKSASMKGER